MSERETSILAWSVVLTTFALLWAPASSVGQGVGGADPEFRNDAGTSSRTVFVGRVLTQAGEPVSGSVVISSAGGQAVSAADGRFALTLVSALEAPAVRVTAVSRVGHRSLTASRLISHPTRRGTTPIGSLVLAESAVCEPSWLPTFGQAPGVDNRVVALVVFDDGSGPALYAGGHFTEAGGASAHHVARWDGALWSPLGPGLDDTVRELAVFDDGNGPALYAGGDFELAGGLPVNHVARWDGAAWSSLGTGVTNTAAPFTSVSALAAFDDGSGSGPGLYVGGHFDTAGTMTANSIARWDGVSWSPVGAGVDGSVQALTVAAPGGGSPALYAGGAFSLTGGPPTDSIARWDGSSWLPLGSGVFGAVSALSSLDDGGSGSEVLIVGGSFTQVGGQPIQRIARWDGTSWSSLGSGLSGPVTSLVVFDDGSGPALHAGGEFWTSGGAPAKYLAKWNGSSWSQPGVEPVDPVFALAVFDDHAGDGPKLVAGGGPVGQVWIPRGSIAAWDGDGWSPLGPGLDTVVWAVTVFDDGTGTGPALYAGGLFGTADGQALGRVARWNGSSWEPLGAGVSGWVRSLAVFDDGTGGGPALYVGGYISSAGGLPTQGIARWDGANWSQLGSGVPGHVLALEVFDDGSGGGPALYVGGQFSSAGGVAANNIARFDATGWSPLGSGMNSFVQALEVFDDGSGSGPALHAGGAFTTAGGVPALRIARWTGSSWSALGTGAGLTDTVEALQVFDDGGGSGPALYVAGRFASADGVPVNRVARWDGSRWTPLGRGMSGGQLTSVHALVVHDDGAGHGPALYAGGSFLIAGEVHAANIARWDGTAWSAMGRGMSGPVEALVTSVGVEGPMLFAGGQFPSTIDSGDSYVARWGCQPAPMWLDQGGASSQLAQPPRLRASGPLTPGSTLTLALHQGPPHSLAVVLLSFDSNPIAFLGGTLHAVPVDELFLLSTDAGGEMEHSAIFPGAASGSELWLQVALEQASVPVFSASLSNAVKGTVP